MYGPCSACGDGDTALEYHKHYGPRAVPSSLRYTLPDIRALAAEYANTHKGVSRLSVQVMAMRFIEWIERREKERMHVRAD